MKKGLFFASFLSVSNLFAALAEAQSIEIENAWARESPPMVTTGAAYMTLMNRGRETDRLTGVTGNVADRIELHAHIMEDNVMQMRQIEGLDVAPGEPTVLEPGGLHLMLIDLKALLKGGESFPLTLHFEKAGDVPVDVSVRGRSE